MNSVDTLALLRDAQDGEKDASDRLFEHVYSALRDIARSRLRSFRPGQTLNTTSLVHEAYLRLVQPDSLSLSDKRHFYALAARAMRFVLIDYAREQSAKKRGGDETVLALDTDNGIQVVAEQRAADLLALDEALENLRSFDESLAQVVELRFFGGYTHDEIGEILGFSEPTARRRWVRARAWLHQALQLNNRDT